MNAPRPARGFTLVELLTVLALTALFVTLALPSFNGLRQRAALRGASSGALAFWNESRYEAIKRNEMVKVGVFVGSDGAYCLGAATTQDAADTLPCDCRTPAPATNACDVGRFPSSPSEWRGVSLAGVTLGGTTQPTAPRPAVIEPMRTMLTEATDAGTITLASPGGAETYAVRLAVDRLGRGLLCESDAATNRLPEYTNRRCAQ
jgi:prepilin-type N-terminal cleavage/methylation domain-containing protein